MATKYSKFNEDPDDDEEEESAEFIFDEDMVEDEDLEDGFSNLPSSIFGDEEDDIRRSSHDDFTMYDDNDYEGGSDNHDDFED